MYSCSFIQRKVPVFETNSFTKDDEPPCDYATMLERRFLVLSDEQPKASVHTLIHGDIRIQIGLRKLLNQLLLPANLGLPLI